VRIYYLYILVCDDAFLYVGITKDVNKRLSQHRNKYSPYTKRYEKIDLVYTEEFSSRGDAECREKQLKGWSRAKKKALINKDLDKLISLSSGR
jgi:putative endonuclease